MLLSSVKSLDACERGKEDELITAAMYTCVLIIICT